MAKKKTKQEPKPEIKVNLDEWSPERFRAELTDPATGRAKPFTPENKAALYALSREQAIQLDPQIFQRWRMANDPNLNRQGGKGRGKQVKELKDWSEKIRKLLNDRELTATMLNQKKLPKWLNPLIGEDGEMPAPSEVIGATLMAKAMTGDVRAIEELRKMGFGDKVTIDAGESFFNKQALKLEIIDTTQEAKDLAKKELNDEKKLDEVQAEPLEVVEAKPEPTPEPIVIEKQPIPKELEEEFERHELERQQPAQPASNTNSHGIDRGLLNKVTITKHKNH